MAEAPSLEEKEAKGFMQDQVKVPGCPKNPAPDGLRVCVWVGLLAGIICGIIMRLATPHPYSTREAMHIRLVGDLWVSAMRAVALPLFVITLATAIYDMSFIASARLFRQLFLVVLLLRAWMGVQTGVVAALANAGAVTKPDHKADDAWRLGEPPERNTPGQAVLDLLRNTFAENPVDTLIQSWRTTFKPPVGTNQGEGDVFNYTKAGSVPIHQANLLGLVLWGTAVGMAMVMLRNHVQSLVLFLRVANDVALSLTEWLYHAAMPFILMCVAADVAGAWQVASQYQKMGAYVLTVMVQLLVQLVVLYPVLTAVTAARRSRCVLAPWYLLWFSSEALVVAGVAASAHVAYPLMLRAVRRVQGIDTDAAALVLSVLSVWLNDGTAIYLMTAGTWLAQDQSTYVIKETKGYVIAAILSAIGSVSAAGESRMHAPLTVVVGATMQADTTSLALAPIMHWDWLVNGCVCVVNISGAFFFAIILGFYALRRKQKRRARDLPVNRPITPPQKPQRDADGSTIKPLDEEVYPPLLEDPELEELRDRLQVRKELRRAARADKAATQKEAQVAKAKDRAAEAETALKGTDQAIQEAEATA